MFVCTRMFLHIISVRSVQWKLWLCATKYTTPRAKTEKFKWITQTVWIFLPQRLQFQFNESNLAAEYSHVDIILFITAILLCFLLSNVFVCCCFPLHSPQPFGADWHPPWIWFWSFSPRASSRSIYLLFITFLMGAFGFLSKRKRLTLSNFSPHHWKDELLCLSVHFLVA